MSNFQTFGAVTEGLEGSAPARFIASTTDSLATIIAAGYLNDKQKIVKANDVFDINYSDGSVFPLNIGESSLFGSFGVQYDPGLGNWNLIPKSSTQINIAAYGVHSAVYTNAGGSATATITDATISPNSVVIARLQSSANPVIVQTVQPANGSVTIVFSGDPGSSVIEYISILPSVALQGQGVFAAQYSYIGGSATIVITNPLITASMIVNANFASQFNAALFKSVVASAGFITIVATANPGASIIEYVALLPSAPLLALGFYGATYVNAGGSATTTITDANITTSSIVTADWASQANAAEIEKVTPGAGSLTILSSANPGASVLNYLSTVAAEGIQAGTYLVAANNLADVQSPSASLANLGGAPLAGGQLTGSLFAAKGVATTTGGAATVSKQAGVLTTPALTTAGGATYAITLTNTQISASSVLLVSWMGGTNTVANMSFNAVPGSGSATITIYNNTASTALNGTVILGFEVL